MKCQEFWPDIRSSIRGGGDEVPCWSLGNLAWEAGNPKFSLSSGQVGGQGRSMNGCQCYNIDVITLMCYSS